MKMIRRWSIAVLAVVALGAGFAVGEIVKSNQEATEALEAQGGIPVSVNVVGEVEPPEPEPEPAPEPEPEPEKPTPPRPPVPTPETDVCPNMPGIQNTVPEGYYLDLDLNNCLPTVPPTADEDVCLNLPGIQNKTPDGMVNDDGYCYIPTTVLPPVAETGPPLKNVPDFLQPAMQFLVDLVPEGVQEFFRDLPEEVVNQIPIYVFVLALIFILIPLLQSIREYYYRRKLLAFYKREQNIAEEKDNFITIASHYIRTPIAIMRDTLPLMMGTGMIAQEEAARMNIALQNLGNQVTTSLDEAQNDPLLQSTVDVPPAKPFWKSGFFWLPIILSLLLTLLINFFIGVVGDKEIGTTNTILQIVIIVGFIVAVYLLVRNLYIQRRLRQENDALIAREQTIDNIRNRFLEEQATNISTALSALYFTSPYSPPPRPYLLYNDGISRLSSIHDKFILLSQVKTGAGRNMATFDLKTAVDRAITSQQVAIEAKNVEIQNAVGSVSVTQNEPLFSFVISSVIDNAVKFVEPGGKVFIGSQPGDKMISIRVSDNGKGIDPNKIDQLFKPFSRGESAVNFAYEGLGLSLFLDRLILAYTGGDIYLNPRNEGGTDVTIVTPSSQDS